MRKQPKLVLETTLAALLCVTVAVIGTVISYKEQIQYWLHDHQAPVAQQIERAPPKR